MIKDGTIKRADAMKARYGDIHVKPGFNLRDLDEEYETGVEDLTAIHHGRRHASGFGGGGVARWLRR